MDIGNDSATVQQCGVRHVARYIAFFMKRYNGTLKTPYLFYNYGLVSTPTTAAYACIKRGARVVFEGRGGVQHLSRWSITGQGKYGIKYKVCSLS